MVTKDEDKVSVTPVGLSIFLGDPVTFTATGNELRSELRFDIRQGPMTLQSLAIHTSCSKPIWFAIRQLFSEPAASVFAPTIVTPLVLLDPM